MYRVGITKKDGTVDAKNFESKEEAENWLLAQAEKEIIKRGIVVNKQNILERDIYDF